MFSNQGPLRMVFRPLRDLGPGLFFRRQAGPYIGDVGEGVEDRTVPDIFMTNFPPQ